MSKEKNDITLRVFAVIIAVVMWSYVMSEVNPEQSQTHRNIPVTFRNLDALDRQGLVLMSPTEATVTVRVIGTKSDLATFESKFIKAQVDLAGYSEGQVKIPVNITFDQSNNIRLERVEPQDVLFTLDRYIRNREKPVTVKTTGKLDDGYVLGDITTKVQSVSLEGPRSWVNEVEEVVATVNLNGRTEDANIPLAVKLVDDEGKDVAGVKYGPTTIDVNIPIFKTVTVPIELNLENEPPENYEITGVTITPSRITLKGDKNIGNLRFIQTKPIDINYLMENANVPIELELPPNVSLLNPDEKVTISLKIEENFTKSFEYTLDDIDIRNLADGLDIDRGENISNIEILVKGSKEGIENLTKEDLQVYLDLNMLTEGTHRVYLGFNAPLGITIKEILPQPIELKLINN